MTCERMMLSLHPDVNAKMVIGAPGRRTSRDTSPFIPKDIQRKCGFNEPTDTVVWNACLSAGLGAEEFLLWNMPLPLFAVGKKSEETLRAAGFDVCGLRHPANGGANLFREGLSKGLREKGLI